MSQELDQIAELDTAEDTDSSIGSGISFLVRAGQPPTSTSIAAHLALQPTRNRPDSAALGSPSVQLLCPYAPPCSSSGSEKNGRPMQQRSMFYGR